MPIYQYLCPSCNHEFELRQSFTDDSRASCPRCDNGARRIFSPVPIIFKGSGFYVTDNGKKGDTQESPIENKSENKIDNKTEDKTENIKNNKSIIEDKKNDEK